MKQKPRLAPSSGSTTPTRHRSETAAGNPTLAARGDSVEPEPNEEIVLTGDDLVVEYAARLVDAMKDRPEIPSHLSSRLDQFIHYKVWSVSTLPAHLTRLDERLAHRVADMRERKFKLFLSKSSHTAHNPDARTDFQRAEALKKQHLDNLSDR